MTKNEIILRIAEKTELPTASCEAVIDTFADELQNCLVNGDRLILKGFMSFEVCELPERGGRNPRTGEITTFPSVRCIKCRPSKAMKDAVNARQGVIRS